MAQIREIKRRIRSINNTSKVTHAMELVSVAKMRKAQEKALASRPYTNTLHELIAELRPKSHKSIHHLLRANKSTSNMIILISSDRGLVGGLNLNLFREISNLPTHQVFEPEPQSRRPNSPKAQIVAVGKKALAFAARSNTEVIASFLSDELPFLDLAHTLTKMAIDSYHKDEVGQVFMIYPHYESTVKQVPITKKLLPVDLKEESELPDYPTTELPNYLLFEPSPDKILSSILPHHVLTQIYQALLEAKASEHSARMVAMKNATDAANDLVDDLTLAYNQARQEAITKELLDIVTAQSAFE